MALSSLLALVTTTAPITGGSLDGSLPAVVVVLIDAHAACSGTLIAPDYVLTAAHCIPGRPAEIVIQAGVDLAHPIAASAVDALWVHPRFDGVDSAADVAVLHLRDPIDGIAPIAILAVHPDRFDAPVTIAGFGREEAAGTSETARRIGTVRIANAGDAVYTTAPAPSQVCNGDSGGPLLYAAGDQPPALLGVISAAEQSCTDWGLVARLDAVAAWMSPFTRGAPGAIGDRCVRADQCADGLCVAAPGDPLVSVCAAPCGAGGCPGGSHCAAGEVCVSDGPAPGAAGAACASYLECVVGTCAVWTEGEPGTCTTTCLVDDNCPGDQICADTVAGGGACRAGDPDSGGCGAGRGAGGWIGLLIAALVLAVRPRRTPCSLAAFTGAAA